MYRYWLGAVALMLSLTMAIDPASAQRGNQGGGGGGRGQGGGGGARVSGGGGGPRASGGGGGRAAAPSRAPAARSAPQRAPSVTRSAPQRAPAAARPAPQSQRAPSVTRSAPQTQRAPSVTRTAPQSSPRTNVGRPDYDLGARTRTDTGARTANRDLDARSSAGVRSDRSDTNRAPTRADINRQLGIREDARVRTDADVRGNANLRDSVRGRVDADGRASANLRDTARARTDADVRGNANLRDRDNARASARAEARNSALLNNPEWMRSIRTDTRTAQTSLARALDRQINVTDRDGVRDRGTARSAWLNDHPDRAERWGRYGNSYRNNWYRNRYYGGNLFGSRFWGGRNLFWPSPYFNYLGLGYGYGGYGGYGQWWGQPSWFGLNRFFGGGWGYGNYAWGAPIYYDYGPGGNLVYLDDGVYYNDTYIASTDAYAASAAQLAYVDPDQVSEQPGDWMPLGTFALITNPENDQMKRFVQLAVDEQGFVAGTLYNRDTDKAYAITGRVDKNTQRVAFRSDSNPDLVYETGIYNLTQDETPLLVHDGREEPTTFLLVRLEQPEGSDIRSAERVDSYDR